jgi:hypothetical protein
MTSGRQTRKRCPPGQIHRDTYVRLRRTGKRTIVPAGCSPGIGPLHKGNLSRFGYEHVSDMSEGRRHIALASAVRTYGSLSVWRKLNAVYIYTRNTAPSSSVIFKADRDWVKAYYGIRA